MRTALPFALQFMAALAIVREKPPSTTTTATTATAKHHYYITLLISYIHTRIDPLCNATPLAAIAHHNSLQVTIKTNLLAELKHHNMQRCMSSLSTHPPLHPITADDAHRVPSCWWPSSGRAVHGRRRSVFHAHHQGIGAGSVHRYRPVLRRRDAGKDTRDTARSAPKPR